MCAMGLNFLLLLLSCATIKLSQAERLHGQIYSSLEGGAACFRRLNGTHQAGCSSSNKGAIGVVHMVKNETDARWLVFNSSAGPYMAVVSAAIFHDVVEIFMGNPQNVAGILLYENATERTNSFSQDSTCPNEYSSGPGSQCSANEKTVWNGGGTGLIRRDIPFPIFYLPAARSEEIVKITQCYERYNLDLEAQVGKPLCSIQLNSFMWAAVNSIVCRRRSAASALLSATKVCDPLGDNNVYFSLFPRDKGSQKRKKVILITSRIDSASLFDGVSPGAASSVVGMVTHMTAAITLSKMIPATDAAKYDKNVLWTLLNGEAFDYIGSQRVAFDLARGAWPPDAPLAPTDLALHVEIGQIGGSLHSLKNDASWPLYAFVPNDPGTLANIREFLAELTSSLQRNNMSVISPEFSNNLPPSSLHSFRRILRNLTETGDLPELLISDHSAAFTNMFYNSAMDDYEKIDYKYHNITVGTDGVFVSTDALLSSGNMSANDPQVKVARVATALAHTLYQQIVGKVYAGYVTASAHMVDELLYCFLENKMCKGLVAADYGQAPESEEPARAAPLYVGVATWAGNAAAFAGHLAALLAGHSLEVNKTECDAASSPDYSYYWLRGWNHSGVCIETNMNFSEAISPAFITPDYDFTSGEFSTWTESVWQAMWARVFVSAGGGGADAALAAGATATAVTAALTYWLKRNVRRVFVNAPHGSIGSSDAVPGILRTVNC